MAATNEASRHELLQGLEPCLGRLWRYALVLSGANNVAEGLVQATCRRAIERVDQIPPDGRLDRWLFVMLRSIWLEEIRLRRIREDEGFVDLEGAASNDGALEIGANMLATRVLKSIARLPEAQRETAFLVYGESYSYAEAASALNIPIGAVMSRLAAARSALSAASLR